MWHYRAREVMAAGDKENGMVLDAIVIGGSYAGLAAALQLARARRSVLVIDSGRRRNRFASHSHGFLTRDGEEAAAIVAIGREQFLAYPTARWLDGEVTAAVRAGEGFRMALAGAEPLTAKRLVLATGVRDDLPALPGLAERWGKSVFHCPYCHGYELDRGRIGVLATSPLSMHLALLLPDWGQTTFLLNGVFTPDAAQRAQLAARGVAIESTPISALAGTADVALGTGAGSRSTGSSSRRASSRRVPWPNGSAVPWTRDRWVGSSTPR
jgi:thioredoxin reductase